MLGFMGQANMGFLGVDGRYSSGVQGGDGANFFAVYK